MIWIAAMNGSVRNIVHVRAKPNCAPAWVIVSGARCQSRPERFPNPPVTGLGGRHLSVPWPGVILNKRN
jgi:hypothetical protein